MPVAQQIVDQAGIAARLLGALAVGDARRLHHRRIVAHVVDHANEAVIEHRQRLVEDFLQRRHGDAPGRRPGLALVAHLGLLRLVEKAPLAPGRGRPGGRRFRRCNVVAALP